VISGIGGEGTFTAAAIKSEREREVKEQRDQGNHYNNENKACTTKRNWKSPIQKRTFNVEMVRLTRYSVMVMNTGDILK